MGPVVNRIAVMASALLIAPAVGCSIEPNDERPGFWLSGDVVTEPIRDWWFTDDVREIFIETRTRYFLPHSVTIWCVAIGNHFYVGASNPKDKQWVANIARDPNVRLKIGRNLYERKLEPVVSSGTRELIGRSFARKYGYEIEAPEDDVAYWRVVDS